MLCREGRVALTAFSSFSFVTIYYLSNVSPYPSGKFNWKYFCLTFLGGSILTHFVPHPDVAKRGAFIGTVFGTGCVLGAEATAWRFSGLYLAALAMFHLSEYIMTALYKQENLSLDSFLLNHSHEYHMAVVASVVEFVLEIWLLPSIKNNGMLQWLSFVGLALVILGEMCRKLAMVTAKSNFSHTVQYRKVEGHQLVTNGIYSISRHPAYFGWFYWSIG